MASGLFFTVGLAAEGLAAGIGGGALAFGWIYGGNLLLALAQTSLAIRHAIRRKGPRRS